MATAPPMPARRAAFIAILISIGTTSASTTRAGFIVTDLGALSPQGGAQANAISPGGLIAGTGVVGSGDQVAFKGGGSSIVPIGTLPGGTNSQGFGINASGFVVGDSDVVVGYDIFGQPIIQTHAFKSIGGTLQDLGTASARDTFSTGLAINAGGVVAGGSGTSLATCHAVTIHGPGSYTDLGTLGGQYSLATAINDNGVVAGWAQTGSGAIHAFRSGPNGLQDLGTLNNSPTSQATGINQNGDVVGFSGGVGSASSFIKIGNAPLIPLGGLPFATSTAAYGINDADIVVGQASFGAGTSTGFIRDPATGTLYDLNALSGNQYDIIGAAAINNSDQVAATADVNGQLHAVLLTPTSPDTIFDPPPVPEPASCLLLVAGGLGVGACRRLRRGRTAGRGAAGPGDASRGC